MISDQIDVRIGGILEHSTAGCDGHVAERKDAGGSTAGYFRDIRDGFTEIVEVLDATTVVSTRSNIDHSRSGGVEFTANGRLLPRLTYNPSDSVAVGWYRVDPLDHRTSSPPRRLEVGSIVLVPLPAEAAALAAQRVAEREPRRARAAPGLAAACPIR